MSAYLRTFPSCFPLSDRKMSPSQVSIIIVILCCWMIKRSLNTYALLSSLWSVLLFEAMVSPTFHWNKLDMLSTSHQWGETTQHEAILAISSIHPWPYPISNAFHSALQVLGPFVTLRKSFWLSIGLYSSNYYLLNICICGGLYRKFTF